MSGCDAPVDQRRPVPARGALVGACGDGVRRDEAGEVDVGAVQVVAGGQAGLEAHDGRRGLGEDDAVGLDADRAGGAEGIDPRVGAARMDEDLLVLLVPGVERRPLEADRVVEAGHLGGGENWAAPGPVDVADPQPGKLHVTPRASPPACPRRRARRPSRRPGGRSTAGSRATPTRSGRRWCRPRCWPASKARMRRGTGSTWLAGTGGAG